MCRHVIDGMRARGYGRIINISSINGQKGQMGQTNYSAAKAGAIGFTRALAQETANRGITVNAIAPGYIETEMNHEFLTGPAGEALAKRIPMRRIGQPEDLDGALLLLASDAGRYINGAVIPVDGGHLVGGL